MEQREQRPLDNLTWVASLRGALGADRQRRSHEALAKYLYKVGYNYLLVRQNDLAVLASFADEDLTALAEEFVQDFMVKLTADNFALLDKYAESGPFTSFAAVILRRMIAKELAKKSWTTREPWPDHADGATIGAQDASLEALIEHIHLVTEFEDCWQALSERERTLLMRNLVEGDDPQIIGEALGMSKNAVYIAVMRARKKLRACLEAHDILPPSS